MDRRAILSLAGFGLPAAAQPAAGTDPLRDWRGGRMRGFTSAHFRNLSLQTMAAARNVGAGHLRCGLVAGTGGNADHRFDPAELDRAERCLEEAQALGLKLVAAAFVDDGARQRLWSDAHLLARLAHSWAEAARRLARWPALAGLDILNEPLPPGRALPQAQREWSQVAATLVQAIRGRAADVPLLVQPVAGGGPQGFRDLELPPALARDRSLVWSLHFYAPHPITHQRVSPQWPQTRHYPSRNGERVAGTDPDQAPVPFDFRQLERELAPADTFQRRSGALMHVGEFGCVRWAPDDSALRWVRDALELFQARRWGFSFHSWRTWEGWDPELDGADPATATRHAQAPMLRLLRANWAVAP